LADVKILSVVEYDFLNPNWFSSNKKTSSENTRSLSFKIAVNSLPRQLRMVIGRKFLGSKGLPLFLLNGKMYNVILNMYNDVKSCINYNNCKSAYFSCDIGVRQGEIL
jgi:hypothetical protein